MNIIIATLIIILLYSIFTTWLDNIGWKHKEELIDKYIDKVSSIVSTHLTTACDLYKAEQWYLVVYTKDSNYPIWISNNTIRSIHPDPKNCKLIIKQFNGEGVIDNVESYELCAANDLCDYEM